MTALLRLESAAVLRARILWVSIGTAALLIALFVAFATRESQILAFTGYARVVTGVGLAAMLFVPGLALFSTVQVVPAARQSGVLEWYLSHPVSRDGCFLAMGLPRFLAVIGPVLAAVVGLEIAAVAVGEPIPAGLVLRLAAILTGQALCFGALGLWLSVISATPEVALVRGIGLYLAASVLLDFALVGAMLRWHLEPRLVLALSALDPIQAGRLGILAAQGSDLGVLGPVGTWVATSIGPTGTAVYALGWPVVAGVVALALARRAFHRRDLG